MSIATVSEIIFGISIPHIFVVINPTIVIIIADIIINVRFIMIKIYFSITLIVLHHVKHVIDGAKKMEKIEKMGREDD